MHHDPRFNLKPPIRIDVESEFGKTFKVFRAALIIWFLVVLSVIGGLGYLLVKTLQHFGII